MITQQDSPNTDLSKLLQNTWQRVDENDNCEVAQILTAATHPEGIDVQRVRLLSDGKFVSNKDRGHLITFIGGIQGLYRGAQRSRCKNRFSIKRGK